MSAVSPILVVEDDALIRMALVATLKGGGYTVAECNSGAAAMILIDESAELQGLISDINLGDGPDGWAVAHHARQRYPALAVLYVSGESVASWTAEGVPNSLILQKPYAEAQLMTAIASLLIEAAPQQAQDGPPTD
ncbi:response regulator [Novosphingobium ginsenosidimutans]|uniref:Response regulator n=1 Tax=Novosphingobium ginsenosidimutans TaxID=1176536 RepID=A0A5B8S456_9SPHN|nr:response regulator [Novosphingobium ginsenosidimutans]